MGGSRSEFLGAEANAGGRKYARNTKRRKGGCEEAVKSGLDFNRYGPETYKAARRMVNSKIGRLSNPRSIEYADVKLNDAAEADRELIGWLENS